ncbi:MAG TPA: DUF6089 family protein [Ferruginibacter sp.]|nr:DUF6089 family protein [Ferruginibacter sp.]HRO17847.1 DUF6089 family protein [Ferruginibacter sp.]HRQ21284.1 DUF6089 family protein [Ferruginibacter sp.]
MKKVLILLLMFPLDTVAQSFTLDAYAGFSGYQGDLQAKRFSMEKSHPAIALGGSWLITPHIALRALGTLTKVEGSDRASDGTLRNPRNLHFTSRILEAQLSGAYFLFPANEKKWSPYVFAGLAAFHFNPYTQSFNGERIYLQPLGTEGQNLTSYPEVKEYKNVQLAVPFGFGVMFPLTDRVQLGAEFGLRKLFTDYLDDVSGVYADSTILANNRSPLAAQMAYRGNELNGNPPYPVAGSQRGNPANKDWYYTTTIRLSYSFLWNNKKSVLGKTGCPAWSF